jgi:excisionase family DNA binding protein
MLTARFFSPDKFPRIFEACISMPDLSDFLTTEQAARELGYTTQSVRNMVYRHALPAEKFGRSLLIPKKAILEYKKKNAGLPKNSPLRKIK